MQKQNISIIAHSIKRKKVTQLRGLRVSKCKVSQKNSEAEFTYCYRFHLKELSPSRGRNEIYTDSSLFSKWVKGAKQGASNRVNAIKNKSDEKAWDELKWENDG